jgi:hypothetical protein
MSRQARDSGERASILEGAADDSGLLAERMPWGS